MYASLIYELLHLTVPVETAEVEFEGFTTSTTTTPASLSYSQWGQFSMSQQHIKKHVDK